MNEPAEYTEEELGQADGKEGRPIWFAYKGRIYEVPQGSKHWKNGIHFVRHFAGRDLTKEMDVSPHGPDILSKAKRVGDFVQQKTPPREVPNRLVALSLTYHAHPISVHYPVALSFTAALFSIINSTTGFQVIETASICNQIVAALFTPISILTGYFSWRYNYKRETSFEFRGKILLSILYPFPLIGALGLYGYQYFFSPAYPSGPLHGLYHLLVIISAVIALLLGYLGGRITFPD